MRTILPLIAAIALFSASASHGLLVRTNATTDAVSCCGFGTPTQFMTFHVFSYAEVEPGRVGNFYIYEMFTSMSCNGQFPRVGFFSDTGGLYMDGNRTTTHYSGTGICPFQIRGHTNSTIFAHGGFSQVNSDSSSICVQPCGGFLCGLAAARPLPEPRSTG